MQSDMRMGGLAPPGLFLAPPRPAQPPLDIFWNFFGIFSAFYRLFLAILAILKQFSSNFRDFKAILKQF